MEHYLFRHIIGIYVKENPIQKIESNLSKFKRESFKAYNQAYIQFDKLIKNTKELEKLMELRKSYLLKNNAVD